MDIYGTIGPACLDQKILIKMFENGMTGIRLNLSHISLKEAQPMIEIYHEASKKARLESPKLLIDMQGPEIRVGAMDAPVTLSAGTEVILGEGGIPIPEIISPYLRKDQELLLDDGKIQAAVSQDYDFTRKFAKCRVIRGGILQGKKSIALPDCSITTPTLTRQDKENLKYARQYGVTGIMQPFVRSREDLLQVKKAMQEANCQDLSLFAKIENKNGLTHLTEFFDVADEIVIARGDLGNAMPLWNLPGAQKRIARQCRQAGIPFMVVTQMLASMEKNPVPTRAEVSDIYNAVMDGAASVMVTGETAVGKYPAEVIQYLSQTVQAALKDKMEEKL